MATASNGKGLSTPKEAAEILGLKEKYVKTLIREGVLPAKRIGKFMRITQEGLDSFIANLDDSNNGKKRMSENVRSQIKYHAKLKSKESTPKAIQMMTDRILKIKQDLAALNDSDKKVPVVAKYKSTISAKVANMEKMEAITEELGELGEQAYPGMRDFVDEDPDTLEEIFTQEAQGPQEGNHETLQAGAKSMESGEKEPKSMTEFYHKQMESGK